MAQYDQDRAAGSGYLQIIAALGDPEIELLAQSIYQLCFVSHARAAGVEIPSWQREIAMLRSGQPHSPTEAFCLAVKAAEKCQLICDGISEGKFNGG